MKEARKVAPALMAGAVVLAAGALALGAMRRGMEGDIARAAHESAVACAAGVGAELSRQAAAADAAAAAHFWGGRQAWRDQVERLMEAGGEPMGVLTSAEGVLLLQHGGGALEAGVALPPIGGPVEPALLSGWRSPSGGSFTIAIRRLNGGGPDAWSTIAAPAGRLATVEGCVEAALDGQLVLSLASMAGEPIELRSGAPGDPTGPRGVASLIEGAGEVGVVLPPPPLPAKSALLVALLALLVAAGVHGRVTPASRLQAALDRQKEELSRANASWLNEIERRRKAEQRIQTWEARDDLTRLSSRSDLVRRLDSGLKRARAFDGFAVAVVFIGVDRFSKINQSLGHDKGDRIIVELGRRLAAAARPEGEPARIGGDRFAVVLFDIDSEERALAVAERIRREISDSVSVDGHQLFPSFSVGVFVSVGLDHEETALLKAETAMTHAKAMGGDRVELYHPSLIASSASSLQLESDLRRAVEAGDFEAHYQPVVALESKRLVGLEALIRWRHPTDGLVFPDAFIPAAEETGLILSLTRWMLAEGVRQLAEWQSTDEALADLYLSINLSSRDLDEPGLVEYVGGLLAAHDLPPGAIRIEVTESSLMKDLERSAARLEELHELQIPLLLDDFGTGYSSLSYLHHLPFDFVKIDRSFVHPLSSPDGDREIVRAIVDLTHCFGMEAIAEGVETEDDIAVLKRLGCDFAQGYHYSRPLPADRALSYLRSSRGGGSAGSLASQPVEPLTES